MSKKKDFNFCLRMAYFAYAFAIMQCCAARKDGKTQKGFRKNQYVKLLPPKNSLNRDVGGISLSCTGVKYLMNFNKR